MKMLSNKRGVGRDGSTYGVLRAEKANACSDVEFVARMFNCMKIRVSTIHHAMR